MRDKVHVNDLHATILHLLGLDHERLTYRYAGRDFPPDRRQRPCGARDYRLSAIAHPIFALAAAIVQFLRWILSL